MVDLSELFGKRIRGLRRSKDLTQEQLAELAGISLQNMGEIERGKGNPTLVTVEKLSAALGEDLSSIFDLGNSVLTKDQAFQKTDEPALWRDQRTGPGNSRSGAGYSSEEVAWPG